jgi:hypothetical protein
MRKIFFYFLINLYAVIKKFSLSFNDGGLHFIFLSSFSTRLLNRTTPSTHRNYRITSCSSMCLCVEILIKNFLRFSALHELVKRKEQGVKGIFTAAIISTYISQLSLSLSFQSFYIVFRSKLCWPYTHIHTHTNTKSLAPLIHKSILPLSE